MAKKSTSTLKKEAAIKSAVVQAKKLELDAKAREMGIVEAELSDDGKVVQITDKQGQKSVLDVIKDKAGTFIKVAGIVIGLNLFTGCLTTGTIGHHSTSAVNDLAFRKETTTAPTRPRPWV